MGSRPVFLLYANYFALFHLFLRLGLNLSTTSVLTQWTTPPRPSCGENLKRTLAERLANLVALQRLAQEARRAGGAENAEDLDRLVAALGPFRPYLRGAPADLPFEWSRGTILRGLNFTLTTSIGDLDIPWLIRIKRAAGRPKDFEVIAELEALLEERESGA
jgi:hypothetical protein